MLKGFGFMLALIGSTMLDGAGWIAGLIVCAAGAAMMLIPAMKEVFGWTAS